MNPRLAECIENRHRSVEVVELVARLCNSDEDLGLARHRTVLQNLRADPVR